VRRWISSLRCVVALLALFVALCASCARERPYVELVLDTDLPANVGLTLKLRVIRLDRPPAPLVDAAIDARTDGSSDARSDGSVDARADSSIDARVDSGIDARVDSGIDVRTDSGIDVRTDGALDARTDGAPSDGASDAAMDARRDVITLEIDPSVNSQEFRRTADGGTSFPASIVFNLETPYDDRLLIEVQAESSSSAPLPSYSWTQHAIVRPFAEGPTIVRMVLSHRCAFPVRGCGATGMDNCAVDAWCQQRGLTCGEDGACLDPAAVPVARAPRRRPDASVCGRDRCDPWCPPCPAGSSCGPSGTCVRSVSRGCIDNDGDGYGEGMVCLGRDCDDTRRNANPLAPEICDRIDNDCNGAVDEMGICGPYNNNVCAMADAIDLTVNSTTTRLIDTTQGGLELSAMCRFSGSSAGGGRELWYSVTWPSNQELEVLLERVGTSSDPVLVAFDRCPDGTILPLACNDDIGPTTARAARIVVRPSTASAAPRTLVFAADSYSESSSGPMRLTVSRKTPAAPASCSAPYDVGVGGAIVGTFSRDTTALPCTMRPRTQDEFFVVQTGAEDNPYVQPGNTTPNPAAPVFLATTQACGMYTPMQCISSESGTRQLQIEPNRRTIIALEGTTPGGGYVLLVTTTGI